MAKIAKTALEKSTQSDATEYHKRAFEALGELHLGLKRTIESEESHLPLDVDSSQPDSQPRLDAVGYFLSAATDHRPSPDETDAGRAAAAYLGEYVGKMASINPDTRRLSLDVDSTKQLLKSFKRSRQELEIRETDLKCKDEALKEKDLALAKKEEENRQLKSLLHQYQQSSFSHSSRGSSSSCDDGERKERDSKRQRQF